MLLVDLRVAVGGPRWAWPRPHWDFCLHQPGQSSLNAASKVSAHTVQIWQQHRAEENTSRCMLSCSRPASPRASMRCRYTNKDGAMTFHLRLCKQLNKTLVPAFESHHSSISSTVLAAKWAEKMFFPLFFFLQKHENTNSSETKGERRCSDTTQDVLLKRQLSFFFFEIKKAKEKHGLRSALLRPISSRHCSYLDKWRQMPASARHLPGELSTN